jgi:hypothetical protein
MGWCSAFKFAGSWVDSSLCSVHYASSEYKVRLIQQDNYPNTSLRPLCLCLVYGILKTLHCKPPQDFVKDAGSHLVVRYRDELDIAVTRTGTSKKRFGFQHFF